MILVQIQHLLDEPVTPKANKKQNNEKEEGKRKQKGE